MEVAVVAVRVVEGVADDEVDVVPVGNGLVVASGSMPAAALHRGAGAGTAPAHLQPMLVGVPLVGSVEVAVVKVVGMVAVPHFAVSAPRPVLVVVAAMLGAGHRLSR